MKKIRIAIAQINTVVGDLRGNADRVIEEIQKAQNNSSDIVIFPELTISGYPPEDLLLKKQFIKANLSELKRIAKNTGEITAIVGYANKEGKNLYNAAALIRSKKIFGNYHKVFLPNYSVFDEKRYFSPGNECPVFLINGVRIGVNICEDIWVDDGLPSWQAITGNAEILVNISSSPFCIGKSLQRKKLLMKTAKENGVYVVYNNLVGGQDELVFDGGSMVVDPKGYIMAKGKQFEPDLFYVDIPIKKKRGCTPRSSQNKSMLQHGIKKVVLHKGPLFPPKVYFPEDMPVVRARQKSKIEEVYAALVLGVRDYFGKNGFQKAVLGLSGGIDSALTAVIAVDALGSENVVGVTMPSKYSSSGSVDDSDQLSQNLSILMEKIPINRLVTLYHSELGHVIGSEFKGVTEENIQSRIRGNLLMALSNNNGWLLLATGNKSEMSTGYCTLYGDMAGGFAVIKDVSKTLVYELCEHINKKAGHDLIPDNIIDKEPSAELRLDQKDSDSLPPYHVLDTILNEYVEEDKDAQQIGKKTGSYAVVKKIATLVDRCEYKRRQAPPGVKITQKSFGKDRRLPITNLFKG